MKASNRARSSCIASTPRNLSAPTLGFLDLFSAILEARLLLRLTLGSLLAAALRQIVFGAFNREKQGDEALLGRVESPNRS